MGYKVVLGAVPSPVDIRDYKLKSRAAAPKAANFPEDFELTDLPDVLNQNEVGSCVAHTLAEIMAWHYNRQTENKDKMSILGVYGNRQNSTHKGSGMIVRDAIKSVKSYGDPLYASFPGNKEVPEAIELFEANYKALSDEAYTHHITGMARLESEDTIKQALIDYGPVAFVVSWYNDMKYQNGILDSATRGESSGAHCMMIYGWIKLGDKEYWKIQNSWGASWGKKGRAWMPVDMPLVEAWAIIDDFNEGSDENIIKPWHSKLVDWLAKLINKVINLWRKN